MATNNEKIQELKRQLLVSASYERLNNNTLFNIHFDKLGRFLYEIKNLGIFASQVAETVEKTSDNYGYKVARLSEKQAYILAAAAVENGVYGDYMIEEEVEEEVEEEDDVEVEVEENKEVEVKKDFQKGEKVTHAKLGNGEVVSVDDTNITIFFEELGQEKKMVKKFVKLEKIN